MFSKSHVGDKVIGDFSFEREFVYSKVVVVVDDDTQYVAGTDTGETLTVSLPFGTQEIADKMLAKIVGHPYQTYSADTAVVDPAVEIGDAVEIGKIYGGVHKLSRNFDSLYTANISAPYKKEIDHEYTYQSPETREIVRQRKITKASIKILTEQIELEVSARKNADEVLSGYIRVNAQNIEARVCKEGGDSSSFGWKLLNDSMTWYANNDQIVRFDKTGASIKGKIIALSGKIGGFTIESDYLSYGDATWDEPTDYGIYIGVNGIKLGKNFTVDNDGELTAKSGKFGSLSINNKNQKVSGTYYGGLSGCGGTVNALGGSVSKIGGSLSTEINVGSKSIGTFVTDTMNSNYSNTHVGTFGEVTIAGETLKSVKLTLVTGDNSTTTRRFWVVDDNR